MGKLTNGVLGPIVNKVGGIVAFNWKGINAVRAYVVPANPNTSSQQASRALFGSVVNIAVLVLGTICQKFWDPFATKMSGYNEFCGDNRELVTTPFDVLDMKMSKGSLESESFDAVTYNDSTGAIAVGWTPTELGNGLGTDSAVIVVIDTQNNVAFVEDAESQRDVESASLNIGADRVVANLKAFLFFYRGTGVDMLISPSDAFQVTVP